MSDYEGKLRSEAEARIHKDTPPHISSPANGARVGARIVVNGGGHARRNVRAVTPDMEDGLSNQMQMSGDGHFQVEFLKDPEPGKNLFQMLQWDMYPESHRRSPVCTVYYMPAHTPIEPALGDVVGRRPTFSGKGAAPGSTLQIVQAGSGATVYASLDVKDDGTFEGPATEDLPLGQFIYTGRYTLDAHHSDWATNLLINVQ